MTSRNLGKWTPAIVAGSVFAAVVLATILAGGKENAAGSATTSTSSTDGVETVTPLAPSTVPPTSTLPGYTTTTVPYDPITQTLGMNSAGGAVKALQQRLIDLRFDPGPADGYFGEATRAAVWAYEKLVLGVPRQDATGKVTPAVWDSMHQPVEVIPKRSVPGRTHVEVYLLSQVAVVFDDNQPVLITHVSTGSGEKWTEEITIDPGTDENQTDEPVTKLLTGTSITPGGVYTFTRRYVDGDGWRTGSLGRMYKPVYFNYGVAVHGSTNVPNQPASHGCVRIPMHIAEYFPSLVRRGDAIYVFDGVHDPEYYGRQPPPFDQDITPTTTTTTTTTTVPATTTTTTTVPVSTTTTAPKPSSTTTTTTTTTTTAPGPSTSSSPTTTAAAGGAVVIEPG